MLSARATKIIVLLHKVQRPKTQPTDCYLLLEGGGAICLETDEPILLERGDTVDE